MLSEKSSPMSPLHVMAISPGIAIGPVRLYKTGSPAVEVTKIRPGQVEVEQQRLQWALDAAIGELRELSEHVAQTVGRGEADIFEAQQLMLQDPELLTETTGLITQQHFSAAAALHQVAEHQAQELESLENATLAARAADMRDVAARAIRHLQAEKIADKRSGGDGTPKLIVAHDLTPSDTATFDPGTILGICTAVGGPTTHAAIIARAMEIPAIAGFDPRLLDLLHDGQQIAIDGAKGLLYLQLDAGQQQELRTLMRQQQQERDLRRIQNETLWRNQPGSTADGSAVQVFANVGDQESARAAAELGAEGIGLLRTEFLFAGRQVFPGEQEQFDSYVAVFRAFAEHALLGNTIVARTLDAGADKPFPALEPLIGAMQEFNPALGLRGARIHLVHEELLRQQLRALLLAGAATGIQLHIMFPMIATLEEARRLRTIYASVKHELESGGATLLPDTQIGIMVETPAAALMADVLACEVDFFSIGANDLFQYTMAADRTNSRVASMFGMLEPAVWRLIDHVVRAGRAHGKTVALCGELAADPRIGPLLAGLGVQELSMSPPAIANVKTALHKQTMEYWSELAQELLKAETASDMQAVLNSLK
ncbi:MAG: phosphoenolpyruvate--protein phosphotransferase [Chloroflexota bacterium]|nr:MAG: phosphoenolpyruvate--protein phosphotransferase [Chloroflexota bacterium]